MQSYSLLNPKPERLRDWVAPVAGSLLLHGIVGRGLYENLHPAAESVPQSNTIEDILQKPLCAVNPLRDVESSAEKAFVAGLQKDISDGKLDSMSLGEWMVRAEVFQHNKEVYCAKETWDTDGNVQFYKGLEDWVHQNIVPKDGDAVSAVSAIFDFLHNGAENAPTPYRDYFPLFRFQDDEQSRPMVTLTTGRYNCNSGTLWLTALGTSDAHIGDALKVMDYDEHRLGMVRSKGKNMFFETRDPNGKYDTLARPGKIQDKEVFVAEYLRAKGVAEASLPEQYRIKAASTAGLFTYRTNWFGKAAPTGIRTQSIQEEFSEIERFYPCADDGICLVETSSSKKYDWQAACDAGYGFAMFLRRLDPEAWFYSNIYSNIYFIQELDIAIFACREYQWEVRNEPAIDSQHFSQSRQLEVNTIPYLRWMREKRREVFYQKMVADLRASPQQLDVQDRLSLFPVVHTYSQGEIEELLNLDSPERGTYWDVCNQIAQNSYQRVVRSAEGQRSIAHCIQSAKEDSADGFMEGHNGRLLLWRFGKWKRDVAEWVLTDSLRRSAQTSAMYDVMLMDGSFPQLRDPRILELAGMVVTRHLHTNEKNKEEFCEYEYWDFPQQLQIRTADTFVQNCNASPILQVTREDVLKWLQK